MCCFYSSCFYSRKSFELFLDTELFFWAVSRCKKNPRLQNSILSGVVMEHRQIDGDSCSSQRCFSRVSEVPALFDCHCAIAVYVPSLCHHFTITELCCLKPSLHHYCKNVPSLCHHCTIPASVHVDVAYILSNLQLIIAILTVVLRYAPINTCHLTAKRP